VFELPDIETTVATALAEDLGVAPRRLAADAPADPELLERDVTTFSVAGPDNWFSGFVVARQDCVVAGLPVAGAVFETLSRSAGLFEPVEFFPLVAEGARVEAGTRVAEVDGLAVACLSAERTALDFLMVLSGIATETARWVERAGEELVVLDTRKTLPGLRDLSKYAVRVGGGTNHRAGLHDMVLIKDNHLRRAASIAEAVARAKSAHARLEVEVEADTLEQAVAAVEAGADIVLLDNMDDAALAQAVSACRAAAERRGRSVLTEASGSIRFERLSALRSTGVDRVSASALTMAPPVDFGLDEA
jgi:nicotinate-nucleotide pyrophosphorylase (carboxylating)